MGVYIRTGTPSTIIAQYPLNSTTTGNDTSGNGYNLTNRGTSFGTYQGVDCAYFNGSNADLVCPDFYDLSQGDYTVNVWAYKLEQVSSSYDYYVYAVGRFGLATDAGKSSILEYDNNRLRFALWFDDCDAVTNPQGVWTNICLKYTKAEGGQYIYVNGQLSNSRTLTNTHFLDIYYMYIGHNPSGGDFYWKGYLSELIFDGSAWSDQDVLNYYNTTKSNYGIS